MNLLLDTILSYLASRPSRDVVLAGHQAITQEWWESSMHAHDLFISEVVFREIQAGDLHAAAQRVALIHDIPSLALTDDVAGLAQTYLAELGCRPRRAMISCISRSPLATTSTTC